MQKILSLMLFLIAGLILSQVVPTLFPQLPSAFYVIKNFLMMMLLSFIMIEVGREFEIDLKKKKQYTMDYVAAAMAASFPWIFVSIYFYFFLMPENLEFSASPWVVALLVGRFAAPTSAGVLFTMLVAAGLSKHWVFQKAKILAIFDDLDTVLLMIPLQILMVGLVWQLYGVIASLVIILVLGFIYFKKINLKTSWNWILFYGFILTMASELIYFFTKNETTGVGLHIEILLPAFVLGCAIKPTTAHHESRAHDYISYLFLLMVGFSMPLIIGNDFSLTFNEVLFHVLMVTIISNIGKLSVFFFYKTEASVKERLALSVAMFPRGEVGAGVLALAVSYGIKGAMINVAFLALALNLILTGFFIFIVKKLLAK